MNLILQIIQFILHVDVYLNQIITRYGAWTYGLLFFVIFMETGFVVQDVYLEATALGLGTVMVGGFDDIALRGAIGLPTSQVPFAVMPVGRRK